MMAVQLNRKIHILIVCLIGFLSISFSGKIKEFLRLEYPGSWPKPVYNFKNNPLTNSKVFLGRKLFYEPKLSIDNTISCASCHLSFTAFTHVDHALSHGIFDSIGTRNSPALMNLAWSKSFMWDGAVNHLDMQGIAPIENPVEMGEKLGNVLAKLSRTKEYPNLFKAAFGDSSITGERLLKALSAFELTLISTNSKYDKMMAGDAVFTEQERAGLQVFNQHCNQCHTAPLFTNHQFENNGLPLDSALMDMGRMGITNKENDSRKFKVPTLRNIEFSFPYMHDGRFKSLFEVIEHYQNGMERSNTLHKSLLNGITISEKEKVDLIAFLLTLSDKEFCFNSKFGYPQDQK